MKRTTCLAICLVFASACGSKSPNKPAFENGSDSNGDSTDASGADKDDLGTGDSVSLQAANSSHLRFADSIALSSIYARVFKKKDLGFEHCASVEKDLGRLPPEAADCDNIFTSKERPDMGTFDIFASEFGRGPNNKTSVTALKLGYLRTLRVMLLRECTVFIDKEADNLANGKVLENVFVKSESPKAADVKSFMAVLLGIEGRNLSTGVDYDSYANALKKTLVSAGSSNEDVRKAWVNGCVTIAMDPLVFIY